MSFLLKERSWSIAVGSVCWRTDGLSLIAYRNRSRSLDKPLSTPETRPINLFLVPSVIAGSGLKTANKKEKFNVSHRSNNSRYAHIQPSAKWGHVFSGLDCARTRRRFYRQQTGQ